MLALAWTKSLRSATVPAAWPRADWGSQITITTTTTTSTTKTTAATATATATATAAAGTRRQRRGCYHSCFDDDATNQLMPLSPRTMRSRHVRAAVTWRQTVATANGGRHLLVRGSYRFCSCVILDVGGSTIHDNFKLLVEFQHCFPCLLKVVANATA